MEVVQSDAMEWQEPRNTHRKGSIAFKRMITGTPGSPDNFHWTLVRVGAGYFTPRHRHNYDQVRVGLSGRTSISPGVWLKEGQVGFFPEGTYYGPQENTEEGIVLALQGGGASGGGFLAMEQLREGRALLEKEGDFKGGVFRRSGASGPRNQDGYEAVWEKITGRKISYEPARYETPIMMNPENFAWKAGSDDGVLRRRLGAFTERGTQLEFVRAEADSATELDGQNERLLAYVMHGEGALRADSVAHDLRPGAAFEVAPSETASVLASKTLTIFLVRLPTLQAQSLAA